MKFSFYESSHTNYFVLFHLLFKTLMVLRATLPIFCVSFQEALKDLCFLLFMAMLCPLPHWTDLGQCRCENTWLLRLDYKNLCSFSFLVTHSQGELAAVSWRHSNNPTERSSCWDPEPFQSHVSEPSWKGNPILQPSSDD